MDDREFYKALNQNLQSGRLNDAFHLASKRMSFCLENPDFVQLISTALSRLGFSSESKSVGDFARKQMKYRNQFAVTNHRIRENQATRGHSHPYELSGTNPQWDSPVWKKRAEIIANSIPANSRILDLGCGNMLIKPYLRSGIDYIPCDLVPRDEKTIICNFDKQEYPPDQGETHIICLGVLPYLKYQTPLIENICQRRKPFYITFKPKDLIEDKISQGVYPPAPGFNDVIQLISKHNISVNYQFVLGQGDEILLIGKID